MFDFEEYSINESLAPSIGDYELINSFKGNYYRHKSSDEKIDETWIINSDGTITVEGDITFSNTSMINIPFLFKKITGNFSVDYCIKLISLEGCPKQVGGHFNCDGCDSLISLKGCPIKIGGHFTCEYCKKIITFDCNILSVGGNFLCNSCESLISLKGCPKIVGKKFKCGDCKSLISLEGCPTMINDSFSCSGCYNLTSLEGLPVSVGGYFNCSNCESLHSIDYFKCIVNGKIYADYKILSGLVTIQNLYKQYPLLSKIEDYALFVHTILEYAPELKELYKEIPPLDNDYHHLNAFI